MLGAYQALYLYQYMMAFIWKETKHTAEHDSFIK